MHLDVCRQHGKSIVIGTTGLDGDTRAALERATSRSDLVVLTGEIMRMPGLPKSPLAQRVKFHADGTIEGIG